MTALLSSSLPPRVWNAMPGWGIAADLTPPELVAMRRLRMLRKLIAGGLAFVVVLCIAGYAYAWNQHSDASSARDNATAHNSQLTAQQNRYSGVTQIEGAVSSVQGQISSLMKTDVDVTKFVTAVRGALPGTMAITQFGITFNAANAAAGVPQVVGGSTVIGKATLSGTGRTLSDLSTFLDKLGAIPGIVNLVPGSNAAGEHGATQFSLTFDLTDALYSHRYDASKAGGK